MILYAKLPMEIDRRLTPAEKSHSVITLIACACLSCLLHVLLYDAAHLQLYIYIYKFTML